jgi:addiction module HigA family antidote
MSRRSEPAPIAPGEVLRDEVLAGAGITQEALAKAIGVSRFTVSEIINGRRAVTAEMALRLARVHSMTPDFWLNLQRDADLYRARRRLGETIDLVEVLRQPKNPKERFVSLDSLRKV